MISEQFENYYHFNTNSEHGISIRTKNKYYLSNSIIDERKPFDECGTDAFDEPFRYRGTRSQ